MTMFNKRIWGHVAHPHFFVWRVVGRIRPSGLYRLWQYVFSSALNHMVSSTVLLWVCGQPSPPSPRPHATSGVCLCSAPAAHFLGVHPACSPWLRTFLSCPVQTGRPSSASTQPKSPSTHQLCLTMICTHTHCFHSVSERLQGRGQVHHQMD